jgi:hypothetical protein
MLATIVRMLLKLTGQDAAKPNGVIAFGIGAGLLRIRIPIGRGTIVRVDSGAAATAGAPIEGVY